MIRRSKRTLAIVALTTLVGCSSQVVPPSPARTETVVLRLYSTTATSPLVQDLTSAFMVRYPHLRFDSKSGNYRTLSASLNQQETPYFFSNHLPIDSVYWAAPIASDGLVVITHSDNHVADLNTDQLRRIYQGFVTNWRQVGGPDVLITVLSREDGSGTRAEFERLVMGNRRTTANAQIVPSGSAMKRRVSELPGSIGYLPFSNLDSSTRTMAINGIQPSQSSIYSSSYPLRMTIFVIGLQEPQDDYRSFIGWAQSPEGQQVASRQYVSLPQ